MIERNIPKLDKCMIKEVYGIKPENYIEKMQSLERGFEKSLIETLSRIDIKAIVKTDPYSLPFKEEIKITLNGESYMNGPFEFYRVARKIVKELLDKNVYQIRFYLFVNLIDGHMGFGKVEYCFRYTEKTT